MSAPAPGSGRQRIDKWLWHARTVRTRADAAALVEHGHVRLNGKRVTAASQSVRVGDVLTLALDRAVRVLRIESFAGKRGGAGEARELYSDLAVAPQRYQADQAPGTA